MDRDGTGQGYLFEILDKLNNLIHLPLIISGGAGNYKHFSDGLEHKNVDAVSTAHLFNFVGNGLINARNKLLSNNKYLPIWDIDKLKKLKGAMLQ